MEQTGIILSIATTIENYFGLPIGWVIVLGLVTVVELIQLIRNKPNEMISVSIFKALATFMRLKKEVEDINEPNTSKNGKSKVNRRDRQSNN